MTAFIFALFSLEDTMVYVQYFHKGVISGNDIRYTGKGCIVH
jgi:hypothetical protein